MKELLFYGADRNVKTVKGQTPFDMITAYEGDNLTDAALGSI